MDNLIREIASDAELGEDEVMSVLSALGRTLGLSIQRGTAKVSVPHVGEFQLSHRAPRRFINPANGKTYKTPAHKTVHFRPDSRLVTLINIRTPIG